MSEKNVIEQFLFLKNIVGIGQILSISNLLIDMIFWIQDAKNQVAHASYLSVEHIGK